MKEKFQTLLSHIKNAYKSKVIWFNATIAALIPLLPELINAVPQMQPYLPDNMFKTLTVLGMVGNIYLRFHTTTSLAQK